MALPLLSILTNIVLLLSQLESGPNGLGIQTPDGSSPNDVPGCPCVAYPANGEPEQQVSPKTPCSFQYSISNPKLERIEGRLTKDGRKVHAAVFTPEIGTLPSVSLPSVSPTVMAVPATANCNATGGVQGSSGQGSYNAGMSVCSRAAADSSQAAVAAGDSGMFLPKKQSPPASVKHGQPSAKSGTTGSRCSPQPSPRQGPRRVTSPWCGDSDTHAGAEEAAAATKSETELSGSCSSQRTDQGVPLPASVDSVARHIPSGHSSSKGSTQQEPVKSHHDEISPTGIKTEISQMPSPSSSVSVSQKEDIRRPSDGEDKDTSPSQHPMKTPDRRTAADRLRESEQLAAAARAALESKQQVKTVARKRESPVAPPSDSSLSAVEAKRPHLTYEHPLSVDRERAELNARLCALRPEVSTSPLVHPLHAYPPYDHLTSPRELYPSAWAGRMESYSHLYASRAPPPPASYLGSLYGQNPYMLPFDPRLSQYYQEDDRRKLMEWSSWVQPQHITGLYPGNHPSAFPGLSRSGLPREPLLNPAALLHLHNGSDPHHGHLPDILKSPYLEDIHKVPESPRAVGGPPSGSHRSPPVTRSPQTAGSTSSKTVSPAQASDASSPRDQGPSSHGTPQSARRGNPTTPEGYSTSSLTNQSQPGGKISDNDARVSPHSQKKSSKTNTDTKVQERSPVMWSPVADLVRLPPVQRPTSKVPIPAKTRPEPCSKPSRPTISEDCTPTGTGKNLSQEVWSLLDFTGSMCECMYM